MKAEIKKLLKKNEDLSGYIETTDIYHILLPHQEEALKRAIQLHNSQEQVHERVLSHECNPYTNIFEFIEYIEKCKQNNSKKK